MVVAVLVARTLHVVRPIGVWRRPGCGATAAVHSDGDCARVWILCEPDIPMHA